MDKSPLQEDVQVGAGDSLQQQTQAAFRVAAQEPGNPGAAVGQPEGRGLEIVVVFLGQAFVRREHGRVGSKKFAHHGRAGATEGEAVDLPGGRQRLQGNLPGQGGGSYRGQQPAECPSQGAIRRADGLKAHPAPADGPPPGSSPGRR